MQLPWLLFVSDWLTKMRQEQLEALQPHVFSRFQRVLEQERLGHAYLFSGAFASFEMALFLAQSVFCQESSSALPCGNCRSCQLIERGEFSDVTVIAPQGNLIKTETIRELVKQFSQAGFETGKQVFIIRDAEKMHPSAANSLLKVIEEPESETRIFLLTKQEEAVLATIKSRAQLVHFPKQLPVIQRLLEEEGLLRTQASILSQLVSDLEEAKVLAQQKSLVDLINKGKKWLDSLLAEEESAYLQVASLVSLVPEKAEQARLFELLMVLLSERLAEKGARHMLTKLLEARQMWQANVSLQNSLEYVVLLGQREER